MGEAEESVSSLPFEFSKEEVKERIADHWELADDFIEAFMEAYDIDQSKNGLIVSQRRLAMATDSAYQDIARYKNYYLADPNGTKLDCVKRCAYLVKWLLRFKPLMVVSHDGSDPDLDNLKVDHLELANEFFCIYLFENHLSAEVGRDIALSEKKGRDFAYDLLYRGISANGWIALFQMIKDCVYPTYCEAVPFIEPI